MVVLALSDFSLLLLMSRIEVLSRIEYEESLMLEYFGEQYRDYMKRTGRLLPHVATRKRSNDFPDTVRQDRCSRYI